MNVLTKLPHTPVNACGLNNALHFDLRDEAYWHRIGHTLAPKEPIWNHVLERSGMEQLIIKGARGGDFPGEVNVTVAPSRHPKFSHGLFVASNFHFSIPKNEDGTPRSELAKRYIAAEWKGAFDQARRVAYQIFSEIKRDPPH